MQLPTTSSVSPPYPSLYQSLARPVMDKISNETHSLILSYLPLSSLVVWRQVNKYVDALVCNHLRDSYKLSLAFVDQAATFSSNDLDLYTTCDHHSKVVRFLVDDEHYAIYDIVDVPAPATPPVYNYCGGIRNITRLRRQKEDTAECLVDVIQSVDESATTPLPYFWTTLLMNFVTADSVCCAYPSLTIRRRGLFNPLRLLDYSLPPSLPYHTKQYLKHQLNADTQNAYKDLLDLPHDIRKNVRVFSGLVESQK
ncbi:hypothetical protein EVJ58_g7663 [Rhodofomes roseus]|uniref:F-box domain-containing protein n=1 Tax=Rhodofomes roseus TaxID=34475 RepID=A0A4Y9Y2C6_9APHY|nr:hypothetical protein EVJ58_g7663 [Rhodofomes roseus]